MSTTFFPLRGRRAILTGLLAAPFLSGCAAYQAERFTVQLSQVVATALVEKLQVTQSSAEVSGEIQDPEYHVSAKWATGVDLTIRVRGVRAGGRITGAGSGPDKSLDETAMRAIEERLLKEPGFLERAVKAAKELKPPP